MPTTYPRRAQPEKYSRPRWSRVITVLIVVAILIGGASYAGYSVYRHFSTSLTLPGCQAGTGDNALQVDPDQAPIAATIAGVAARMGLPTRALEIAYATALQESKLSNPSGGDRDSVGVFQQRPSQGWGSATELQDPEFAATAFFKALVKVPHYLTLPISTAAQDVQNSADGSAYGQWESTAQQLATAYTTTSHSMTCWYTPTSKGHPQVTAIKARMPVVFGPAGQDGVLRGLSSGRSGIIVKVRADKGWTVANWLMTHASMYGLTKVSYDGWTWSASLTESSWQADPGAGAGSILAS